MTALVIAEHDNATLAEATLNAVTAAGELGTNIHVLVAGADCRPVAEAAAAVPGVEKVRLADDAAYDHGLAEAVAPLVVNLAGDYTDLIAGATTTGKDLMPRVAGLLDTAQISDIAEIVSPTTFIRPIYAGNAMAKVETHESKIVLTVRPTTFAAAAAEGGAATIETVESTPAAAKTRFVKRDLHQTERPDLATARVVISGGRGMSSAENFRMLESIADKLNAAIGASRAAVDAGYAPNDMQVGQTGKVVAPDLYIAVGISGAIQHLAGMKDSKVIVAINKDADAPIFEVADYGLVADLFDALPALETELDKA